MQQEELFFTAAHKHCMELQQRQQSQDEKELGHVMRSVDSSLRWAMATSAVSRMVFIRRRF